MFAASGDALPLDLGPAAAKIGLDLLEAFLAEPHFPIDEEGRDAEGAAGNRGFGIVRQLRFDAGILSRCEQALGVEPCCREFGPDHFGIAAIDIALPHCGQQRLDQRLAFGLVRCGHQHALEQDRIERQRGVHAELVHAVPVEEALEFQRFLDRHGMDQFRMHPALPFNSILLQRVLVAASDEAERQALVEALLPAVWERNIDCGDAEVVGAELAAAGFDAERLLTATQDPGVKAKLADNTEAAVACGAFGIPTFFVDGEMWFGKERLEQIEAYLGGGRP